MLGVEKLDPIGQLLSGTRPGGDNNLSWLVGKLCELGLHIAVLPPGTKVPSADYRTKPEIAADINEGHFGKGWYLATSDIKRVRKYLSKARTKNADGTVNEPNIGWHLGPCNVIVADCDNPGDVESWQRLWVSHEGGQEPLMNILSPGKCQDGVWTHRDGGYFVYRVPPGLRLTSAYELSKAEQADAGREGWVVKAGYGSGTLLPPSVRPEGPYVFTDVPITDAPEWLVEMCTPAPPPPPRERTDFDDEIDDALDSNVDWDDVLRGIAEPQNDDPCGCRVYRRLGGSPRSIVIHDYCEAVRGARCVTMHSDSIIGMFPALQEALIRDGRPTGGKSVSWWRFIAAVKFGGDMGAAAEYIGLDLSSREDRGAIDPEEYGLLATTVTVPPEVVELIARSGPIPPTAPPAASTGPVEAPVAMPPADPDPAHVPTAVVVRPAPVPPKTDPAPARPVSAAGEPPQGQTGFLSAGQYPVLDGERGFVADPRPHYCGRDCHVCGRAFLNQSNAAFGISFTV